MTKFKIRALCLNLGSCESNKASSLFVQWVGKKPFTEARAAIDAFIEQCKIQCAAPAPKLKPCCNEVLARNPKAKACETCGGKTKPVRAVPCDLADYVRDLANMDIDGFGDAAYPQSRYPGSDDGTCGIGDWEFFHGLPPDSDVVEVNNLDGYLTEGRTATADYCVIRTGRNAFIGSMHSGRR